MFENIVENQNTFEIYEKIYSLDLDFFYRKVKNLFHKFNCALSF